MKRGAEGSVLSRAKLFVIESLQRARYKRVFGGGVMLRLANRIWALRARFRPTQERELVDGDVSFERLSFRFTAPYQILAQARVRGIEARISRFIMAECPEGAVAVDVGANCGFLSVVMGLSVGPNGRVLSFECDPFFYGALEENIRANSLGEWCTPVHCAAGTGDGSTQAVDAMIERMGLNRLDFVKVDVDGPDFDVLLGAEKSLARFHPTVVVEMTSNQTSIFDLLSRVGYPYLTDLDGIAVEGSRWPINLVASMKPVSIPEVGTLRAPLPIQKAESFSSRRSSPRAEGQMVAAHTQMDGGSDIPEGRGIPVWSVRLELRTAAAGYELVVGDGRPIECASRRILEVALHEFGVLGDGAHLRVAGVEPGKPVSFDVPERRRTLRSRGDEGR
jgi:hypothetical protein